MARMKKRANAARRAYNRAADKAARANARLALAYRITGVRYDTGDLAAGTIRYIGSCHRRMNAAGDHFLAARRRYWSASDARNSRACGQCAAHVGTETPDSLTTADGYSTPICHGLIAHRACRYNR